jgi:hypothetical protein
MQVNREMRGTLLARLDPHSQEKIVTLSWVPTGWRGRAVALGLVLSVVAAIYLLFGVPPLGGVLAFFRPASPPARLADGPVTGDLADTRLAGIVVQPDHRIAIFAVSGAKPRTLSKGETISGWRIESITETEVSLVNGSVSKTLKPTPISAGSHRLAPTAEPLTTKSASRPPQAEQRSPAAQSGTDSSAP